MYAIARRYGTTVEEIMNLNNLTTCFSIGQILQIPTSVVTPPLLLIRSKKEIIYMILLEDMDNSRRNNENK